MGVAKDSLELAAGTEPWKGEHGGQRLGVRHGSFWSNTARSVPQIPDTIRVPATRPTRRLAAELESQTLSHLSTPICVEHFILIVWLAGQHTTPCYLWLQGASPCTSLNGGYAWGIDWRDLNADRPQVFWLKREAAVTETGAKVKRMLKEFVSPTFFISREGSGRGCPSLRASNEHCFTVRVLRARRAPVAPFPSF